MKWKTFAKPARPTMRLRVFDDGTRYRVFDDGSYRREPVKLRGKAAVKAAKRARTRELVLADPF